MTSPTEGMPPIKLTEQIRGLWFVVITPGESDWLGSLFEGESHNEILYRMCYLKPSPRKTWSRQASKAGESIEVTLEKVRAIAELVTSLSGRGRIFEILRGQLTLAQFIEKIERTKLFSKFKLNDEDDLLDR